MRSLLLAALALTASHSAADACGPIIPKVFLLSSHNVFDGKGDAAATRTFAMLHQPIANADKLRWTMLAPMSYDGTRIANAPKLAAPVTLTLVGDSGTQVVTATSQASIKDTWQVHTPTLALEVKAGRESQFQIAVAGSHTDLAWHAITEEWMVADARTQLAKLAGLDGGITVYRMGDVQIVTGWKPYQNGSMTVLVRDGQVERRVMGTPLGGLDADGFSYVLVDNDGAVTPVMI
jgi:hypothetical protein